MTVKLHGGQAADAADVARIEASVGYSVSPALKEFFDKHDGAEPDPNIFNVSDTLESGVSEFIPARAILDERSQIENISESAYPIAWAEGGNYLIIDEATGGQVLFWDHEQPEEAHLVANDFVEFLDKMMPFDAASVVLSPGQVQSVWVDPALLEELSKET